jgi:hypothetical protein
MNTGSQQSSYQTEGGGAASQLTDAMVETIVRWPMRVTGATMDFMLQGMQRMTGAAGRQGSSGSSGQFGRESTTSATSSTGSTRSGSGSGPGWSSLFTTSNNAVIDTDLSGDDLKYVLWSIVFTKPGRECILQTQQEELVNYSADSNSYAALKLAKFLDRSRHGQVAKPEGWTEHDSETESSKAAGSGHTESTIIVTSPASTTVSATGTGADSTGSRGNDRGKGWSVRAEDQKYIMFLYKVDRRIPRQEEVTRVERVTVERGTRVV